MDHLEALIRGGAVLAKIKAAADAGSYQVVLDPDECADLVLLVRTATDHQSGS